MVRYLVQVNRSTIGSAYSSNGLVIETLNHLFEDPNLFKDDNLVYKDSENESTYGLCYDIDMSKKTAKKLIQTLKKDEEYLLRCRIQKLQNQISKLEKSLDEKRKNWDKYKKKHGRIKAIKKFGWVLSREDGHKLQNLKIKLGKETVSDTYPFYIHKKNFRDTDEHRNYKDDCDALISALESAVALKKKTINLSWGRTTVYD
jgi:hypothetical protein